MSSVTLGASLVAPVTETVHELMESERLIGEPGQVDVPGRNEELTFAVRAMVRDCA